MRIGSQNIFKESVISGTSPRDTVDMSNVRTAPIDQFLKSPEYQSIAPQDSAGMLGFFVQKMQSQGFPWHLYQPADESKSGKPTRISCTDAWRRLRQGQPVVFQPMRNLQMDLGAENWGALAKVGAVGASPEITNLSRFADLSKESKTTGSLGIELRHGEPITVKSTAELKLLYEVYDPQAKVNSEEPVARAANQISSFTQQNQNGAWRFYQETDSNRFARMGKAFVQNAKPTATVGLTVGAGFGVLVGAITHNWQAAFGCVAGGALIFAGMSGVQSAVAAAKGQPLNAVEALGKVLDNQEVVFQKVNRRSVGLPFFKDISWFSDNGPGDHVNSLEQLQDISWIHNPPAVAAPAEAEKPIQGTVKR